MGVRPIVVNDTAQIRRYLLAERARRGDHAAFAELILRDLASGEPIRNAEIHIDWHAAVDTYQYVQILAPRDHGKSEQVVISRVISELGLNPELRIKIVCENDQRAVERIRSLRQHLESNPDVHYTFPHLQPQTGREWSDHRLTVRRKSYSKDASIEAIGILSAGTGGRADLLIFDDPVDYRNALAHPALRSRVKDVFFHDWMQLLEPDGRVIYISTPWHKADLTSELESRSEFFHVIHRIDLEGPDNPPRVETPQHWIREGILWPAKWPREALAARRNTIGSRAFERSFCLRPVSDEESLFTMELIESAKRRDLRWLGAYPDTWPRVVGVDLASSLGTKGSYTVAFIAVVDDMGRRIPVDIVRGRMSFPDTIRLIKQIYQEHMPVLIAVENNAYQASLVQYLAAEVPGLPVIGLTTGSNKLDLTLGVPGLQVLMEQGGWVIPAADEHESACVCTYCKWLEELLSWPVGATSDTVMAMWLAEQAARRIWSPPREETGLVGLTREPRWRRSGKIESW